MSIRRSRVFLVPKLRLGNARPRKSPSLFSTKQSFTKSAFPSRSLGTRVINEGYCLFRVFSLCPLCSLWCNTLPSPRPGQPFFQQPLHQRGQPGAVVGVGNFFDGLGLGGI